MEKTELGIGPGIVRFLAGKCLRGVLLLFLVSGAAFWLVSMSPLDPLSANVGQTAMGSMSQEQIEKLQTYWGVGAPPAKRFLSWAGDFFRGDMGVSLLYRQPVARVSSGEANEFSVADGSSLGDFRGCGIWTGNPGRGEKGECGRQGNICLCPGDSQHPVLLAGPGISYDFCRVAGMVSGGT